MCTMKKLFHLVRTVVYVTLMQPCLCQSTTDSNGCLCRPEFEKQIRRYVASFVERYSSCAEIRAARPRSPSGVYTLHYEDQTSEEVYCFMGMLPGCGEGGWRRIGHLDMTDPDQSCPSELPIEFDVVGNIRSCTFNGFDTCASLLFSTNGRNYTRVCASISGYSVGGLDSFNRFTNSADENNIDRPYLDGVSFTYGNPRNHLWSYAAGFFCPNGCNHRDTGIVPADPPAFVGDDYYCEEGITPEATNLPNGNGNVLWDGENCLSNEIEFGCCGIPNLPWFHRTVPSTADQIEMRVCKDEGSNSEQSPLDQYQIYVQ